MQEDNSNKEQLNRPIKDHLTLLGSVLLQNLNEVNQLYHWVSQQGSHVYCEADEKEQEPAVVPKPKAVVNEHAVVVELLNASVAEVAVFCHFRP